MQHKFHESHESLWIATAPAPDRSTVPAPDHAEVVVIGAGIAGMTAAYALSLAGRQVVVLEADQVASGVSGYTTAKLSTQHGVLYQEISARHGLEATALYAESQHAAQLWLINTAQDLRIDCDLEECASYVYTTDPKRVDVLHADVAIAQTVGLPATIASPADLPVKAVATVRFSHQARFHPRKWLLGLATATERLGGVIVEKSRVTGVSGMRSPISVHTQTGTISAEHVVVATHHPILDRGLFFTRLSATRELVVAGPSDRVTDFPDMYLDEGSLRSMRTAKTDDGETVLVVGGEPYPAGARVDVEAKYARLTDAARELGLSNPTYSWSAHDLSTVDQLPYVGRYHPATRILWVAAGFNHWGMTGGTMAGQLIAASITGSDLPWTPLYDPNRVSARSLPRYAKFGGRVARHLVGDLARGLTSSDVDAIAPGEGRVIRNGAHLAAVYRHPSGAVQSVGANCTHLGCVVNFNNAEKTWDCPCHGSRFGTDGSVLHGPAVRPLPRASSSDDVS